MEQVEPFVKELQEWANFGDEDFNRIMLALSEAVNNAIIHGNKEDSDKKVHISTSLEGQTLKISVRDEGEGFNPEKLPDPLKEENLLNEGGRGIYLIEQYSDDLEFSNDGTKITATFHLNR